MTPAPPKALDTFSSLDAASGHEAPAGSSGLEVWYRQIGSTPIDELSVGDIARALRQRVHVGRVAERGAELLRASPLAGEQFAGELLAAFAGLSGDVLSGLPALLRASLAQDVQRGLASGAGDPPGEPTRGELVGPLRRLMHALGAVPQLHVWVERAGAGPWTAELTLDEPVTIGRAPEVTIQLDPRPGLRLARRHAVLTALPGRAAAWVEVMGHDARLDGRELTDAGELGPGGVLELADVRVTLRVGGP